MKFNKFNVVTFILTLLVILAITGKIFNLEMLSNYSWMLAIPLLVFLYYSQKEKANHFFGFFLIGFSIAEILKVVAGNQDIAYYGSNIIVILSYVSLLIYLVKDFNLKKLIKTFKLQLIVLIVFNSYLVFSLNQMILQDEGLVLSALDLFIEVVYNIQILLLLSFALLHFLYHETKKGLLLFFASVCIVFSEMVQVAYIFISSEQLLQISYSVLMAVGFYFVHTFIRTKTIIAQ